MIDSLSDAERPISIDELQAAAIDTALTVREPEHAVRLVGITARYADDTDRITPLEVLLLSQLAIVGNSTQPSFAPVQLSIAGPQPIDPAPETLLQRGLTVMYADFGVEIEPLCAMLGVDPQTIYSQ
ncbi:hypothetical protein [Halalkalirubrum salinum]|uniref:hypothetical protein n=1 Tax=Halalkalirubrum salinum TaxID=2563889 RepID=UPI0010FB57AB|nr:hypothetical protein [Halalkalirubrum salinum]